MASGGHTAQEAERQASRLPAFQGADPAHINLFAAANVRLWDEIAQSNTNAWTTKMAQAAKSWSGRDQIYLATLVCQVRWVAGKRVAQLMEALAA
jgi:hypothetical protein